MERHVHGPQRQRRHTVAICFVVQALEPLRQRGGDCAALLHAAGIDAALLGRQNARVGAEQYRALWRALTLELDDEFFGLDSHRLRPGSFAAVCRSVLHCGTLGEAVAHACTLFGLLLDALRPGLRCNGPRAALHLTTGATPVAPFAHETLLMLLHGLMCWLAGQRIALDSAAFAYAAPPHREEYLDMFTPCLYFGTERTELRFNAALLALPVVQNDASLAEFLVDAPQSVILKYKPDSGLATRLRRRLRTVPYADWPTFDALAAELGMSAATLRRRIADEGQSIRRIKAQLRRELAVERLSHSREPITAIAVAAGFSEPGAFHRAFKRWTGARPRDYRRPR